MRRYLIVFAISFAAVACGARQRTIPGTGIRDCQVNRRIIETVERYRTALENGDGEGQLLLAHKQYREDSGTPTASDDYGIEGLREVLKTDLEKASDIRYAMRYVSVQRSCGDDDEAPKGCRARVEVLVDASFSIKGARGEERRPDKRDQNEFVLEWNGERWQFISGM